LSVNAQSIHQNNSIITTLSQLSQQTYITAVLTYVIQKYSQCTLCRRHSCFAADHFAHAAKKYSPSLPDSALQLSVAENQMLEDLLLVLALMEFSSSITFLADAIIDISPHMAAKECGRQLLDIYRIY
jgi:hypothetical protein